MSQSLFVFVVLNIFLSILGVPLRLCSKSIITRYARQLVQIGVWPCSAIRSETLNAHFVETFTAGVVCLALTTASSVSDPRGLEVYLDSAL